MKVTRVAYWEICRIGPIEVGIESSGKDAPTAAGLKAWMSEVVPKEYQYVLYIKDPHRHAAESLATSISSKWPGHAFWVKVQGRSRCWTLVEVEPA